MRQISGGQLKRTGAMEKPNPENQHLSLFSSSFTAFLCVIFGANAVAIKVGLSGIGPFTTAGIRFGLAALVIFIWSRMTGQTLLIKKGQLRHILALSAIFSG